MVVHQHKGASELEVEIENEPTDPEAVGGQSQLLLLDGRRLGMIIGLEHVDADGHPPSGAINYSIAKEE